MCATQAADPRSEVDTLLGACGLVDRSERGKLALTGSGAVEFLGGQVTNELADMSDGEGRYAAFLTHKGKMLGDLRILAVGEPGSETIGELLLDTERVALQALFDMIRRFKIGYDVELHKRTLEYALLSLIGPDSRDVIAGVVDPPVPSLGEDEHSHLRALIGGREVRMVSTYEGVDLFCESPDRDLIHAALVSGGARVVSETAAEVVRVERGRPRFGLDIDECTIPQEAGLNERAVSFTKGCYVGQETVARLYYKGKPNRYLAGLRLSEPVAPGQPLSFQQRVVGSLGSSVLSPTFGPIGLALIRREAPPDSVLSVGETGASAEVVQLPFRS